MKRTTITRGKPIRRRTALNSKPKTYAEQIANREVRKRTKHARRPRAGYYMAWVKTLPCYVGALERERVIDNRTSEPIDPCFGAVEADHAGSKTLEGDGTRAYDATCIPLCTKHHRQRHDFSGLFAAWRQREMREFLAEAILVTQTRARDHGVEVPSC